MRTLIWVVLTSTLAAVFSVTSAASEIRHVANNGVDGAACGSPAQPCRSISRAIRNAREGDTILVGAGLYGDLNRDGDFLDPGDEAAEPTGPGFCVLCIRKHVRVLSTNGADATRIEGLISGIVEAEMGLQTLVLIDADSVTFGTPGHGFELAGGHGFLLDTAFSTGNQIIGGNVARRTQPRDRDLELLADIGFVIRLHGGSASVTGNAAIGSHFGILVSGQGSATLTGNSAINNTWEGITAAVSGPLRLFGNFASGNGAGPPASDFQTGQLVFPLATGIRVESGNARVEDNISVGNYGPGFRFVNTSPAKDVVLLVRHNAASGNQGAGVLIAAGGRVDVRINNIFGNLGSGTGCGFSNESGKMIDATQNFWGASTGPGPDPADKAGTAFGCDKGTGSSTVVRPFAIASVPVTP